MNAGYARWTLLVGASLMAVAAAPPVRAENAPVSVQYEAVEGCPSEADLVAAVKARGATIVAGGAGSSMRISITRDSKGQFDGALRAGASAARTVHGESCPDVMNALAIVAVSALASDAANTAPPPSEVVGIPGNGALTGAEGSASATDATAAPEPMEPPRSFTIPPREVTVRAGTLELDRDIAVAALAGVVTGLVPGVFVPTLNVTVTRTNLIITPEGTGYRLTPSIRLHLGLLADSSYASNFGSVALGGETVGIDSCAALSYDRRGLVFFACAEFAGGLVGYKVTEPSGVKGPLKLAGIGTAGVGFDLTYNLTRHFHLTARFGGGIILGRVSPESANGQTIFQSSTFSLNGMIGAGGHF